MTRTLLSLAGLLLLASGCGDDAGARDRDPVAPAPVDPSPTAPTARTAPTVPPQRAPSPSGRLPLQPTDVFEKVRVVGTVTRGADGCVDVLDANGITWTLLGPEAAGLRPGQQVQVTGRSQPAAPGPGCGIPLTVQQLTVTG